MRFKHELVTNCPASKPHFIQLVSRFISAFGVYSPEKNRVAEAWYGPSTARSLRLVALSHGYDTDAFIEFVRGKKVLDIGVGRSALASQIKNLEIGTDVFSIDLPKALYAQPRAGNMTGKEVAAVAQNLPFRDEAFDIALETFSLPLWGDTVQEQRGFVADGLRVANLLSMAPARSWGQFYSDDPDKIEEYYFKEIYGTTGIPEHTFRLDLDARSELPIGCEYATDRMILERIS